MTTAIANARLTVAAPVRKPRRFGLLSVVDVVDGGDAHWMLGGLTADGEECSQPLTVDITCAPTGAKTSMSWYSDIEADPWLAYMYETCKTVGRYSEAAVRLRSRFLAAEQSAVELGFQENVLSDAVGLGSTATVPQAIGLLEAAGAAEYGGQIILHMPFVAAEEASHAGMFERVGDHLETATGSLVDVGNYSTNMDTPTIYATGAVTLYRGPVVETGPVLGLGSGNVPTNDYYSLIERPYAALVDCFSRSVVSAICGCTPADSGGGA